MNVRKRRTSCVFRFPKAVPIGFVQDLPPFATRPDRWKPPSLGLIHMGESGQDN
jgi:hypothetical protein